MFLEVDLSSDEPIYRQIRAQIVSAVASGELAPGDSLPSVRSLAGDLGVNMHTVNKAYAMLRDEGYVTMRGRSGAVIADITRTASPARAQEHRERLTAELARLATELKARGGTRDEFVRLATTQADAVFCPPGKGTRA